MARPTNSVRVIVAEASGCCASDDRAIATARPSPSAGAIVPNAVVRPAVAIDATAMVVRESTGCPWVWSWMRGLWGGRARARRGRDVHGGEDAEDVRLDHPG